MNASKWAMSLFGRRATVRAKGSGWRRLAATLLALCVGVLPAAHAQEGANGGPPGDGGVTIHIVQEGDTLPSIASQFNIGVDALRRTNNLASGEDVAVGQRLVVPSPLRDGPEAGGATIPAGLADSLYSLAARHGLTAEYLGHVNRVANPTNIVVGQAIYIPPSLVGAERTLMRVPEGSSFWRMAVAHGLDPARLMLLNGFDHPALVQPGTLLLVEGQVDGATELPAPWATMALHPLPLETGRTASLNVETRQPGTLTVSFMGQDWPVISDGTAHQALLPVDRWTTPGLYPLAITFVDDAGASWTYNREIVVADGGYPREVIRLADDIAAKLDNESDVASEVAYVEATMSGFSPERRWADGPFRLPAAAVLASGFGTLRAYNDDVFDQYHTGADLGGAPGTPIYAPAAGVVVDTGLLEVRGYITIIDHGWGVYTGYWHQSSILVEPGEEVAAGQQIGTIGNTGLSTAAHLHWEMRVHGVLVDPMQWARQSFP